MNNRLLAAGAAVLIVGAAGCASPQADLGGTNAKVTINGESAGGPYPVRCTQTEWLWTIGTPDQANGFTALVDTGDEVTVRTVDFRDLDGFSGSFWRDNIGEADVEITDGTYTITGSADGAFTDNPSDAVTAEFRIEATC